MYHFASVYNLIITETFLKVIFFLKKLLSYIQKPPEHKRSKCQYLKIKIFCRDFLS